jgi:heptosyltransferase III
MRKVLVLRGGALGDFIVTLPALALLRQRWPNAQIHLAGNATAAALGRRRRLLDAVHSQHEARWSALYGEGVLPADFGAWLAEFDLVVNYWPDSGGELRRRFPLRPGQTYLTAAAMPERAPAAAHYCAPLVAFGLPPPTDLVYPLTTVISAPVAAAAPIVIHPGSGSPRKNWPAEQWRQLLAELTPPCAIILGEAESPTWETAVGSGTSGLARPPPEMLRNRPLEELVLRLAECRLFIGHDSGISHLAAACGARCVLLFGPTDPAVWAPPAPSVQVLRAGPELRSLPVSDVAAVVAAALKD